MNPDKIRRARIRERERDNAPLYFYNGCDRMKGKISGEEDGAYANAEARNHEAIGKFKFAGAVSAR